MFKSTGILDIIELQPLFRQEFASFLIYTIIIIIMMITEILNMHQLLFVKAVVPIVHNWYHNFCA